MTGRRRIIRTAVFLLLCMCFFSLEKTEAYGGGTQEELYPQVLTVDYLDVLSQQKLENTLAERGETRKHTLRVNRKFQEMRCPVGKIVCEVELPKDIRYGGITPVRIKVYVDDVFYRAGLGYYELHVYDRILTAVHDLKLEAVLKPADVRVEEREVEGTAHVYLTDWKQIAGRVPSRIIRSGTALTDNMFQNPIVMDVGAPVTILSDVNGIQIKTAGIAMQRGRVGKIIRVRNASSSRVLRAEVIDAATVKVLS